MMFENNLTPQPTLRSQLVSHLPIAVLVLGVLATMIALHLAVTGVLILAVAHVAVGGIMLAVRAKHGQVANPASTGDA